MDFLGKTPGTLGKLALSLGAVLGVAHPQPGQAFTAGQDDALPSLARPHLADSEGIPVAENGEVRVGPGLLLSALLKQHQGIVLAAPARAFIDTEYLREHLPTLAASGVKHWYTEALNTEQHALLEQFNLGHDVALPLKQALRDHFSHNQGGAELSSRVEAVYRSLEQAHQSGIRVYPLGLSMHIFADEKDRALYQAGLVAQRLGITPGKVLVTMTSRKHLATLDDILHWPSLCLYPTDKAVNLVLQGEHAREYAVWLSQPMQGLALPEHVRRSMLLESDRMRLKLKNRA